MKQIYPDLWQTRSEARFGTLQTHAYILEHRAGRDMVYVSESATTLEAIKASGPVDHLYLSHNHEITDGLFVARSALGVPLAGHREMGKFFPKGQTLDQVIDTSGTGVLGGGIEAIHTPGHTDNNICYRYVSSHGKIYLFVGDTLYTDRGTWNALFMERDGGDRATLAETLENLKGVEADVIIPSVAVGEYLIAEMNKPEWHAALDAAIKSLR